ncbi:AAA family ATPase [Microlunatus elymi]|uniref:AAA family ATPase n=1 Tax=Microlunatus elymi TaxID=2596828 RepID=A0A516Q110_9ACTN|nr:AAA family ATPase [Microlunatus elymi]QDP97072.1 AAA family ATPase [Microlunatus elymi]
MSPRRVLITGVSGVGKSTLIIGLQRRGYCAVDLDYHGYSRFDDTGDWVWDVDRIRMLLDAEDQLIFVSGSASNMAALRPRFDRVVLLTAPAETMRERLLTRTNNPYGKTERELAESLQYKETVEPLLRRTATVEIDTCRPVEDVIQAVLDHLR